MSADGIKLSWNVKKEEIDSDADKLMERMKKVYDEIGALSDDQITYENVVQTGRPDVWLGLGLLHTPAHPFSFTTQLRSRTVPDTPYLSRSCQR
ncbi:hypothetical protein PoB_003980600 [Plakobranchus ocellatus]|uniref:Uncharacterized protein n=1 Tax=Plakobranchus ocellatus TaxID=259542 RepID=A0AAV4AQ65_9GAST|nr:hypothetical protein PoB_003980600 [Plakobranchus ocellatus]